MLKTPLLVFGFVLTFSTAKAQQCNNPVVEAALEITEKLLALQLDDGGAAIRRLNQHAELIALLPETELVHWQSAYSKIMGRLSWAKNHIVDREIRLAAGELSNRIASLVRERRQYRNSRRDQLAKERWKTENNRMVALLAGGIDSIQGNRNLATPLTVRQRLNAGWPSGSRTRSPTVESPSEPNANQSGLLNDESDMSPTPQPTTPYMDRDSQAFFDSLGSEDAEVAMELFLEGASLADLKAAVGEF